MTSTTDTAGHPDVAEISDLTEGLLPPSRTADLRRHLDQCELCADVHASLEEIRELLGTLPGPARMPADVAGRIDAALAAEALLNATAPDDTEATLLLGDARPASGAGDSVHVSRETSATADRPAGHARSSTTGPGRKNRKKAGRRKVAILGAAFTAAALGLGSVLLTSLMGGGAGPSADGGQTGNDTFSAAKLENQVADLLAKSEGSSGDSRKPERSLGAVGEPDTESPQILREITVPECVRKGIGRDDAALATEEGVYQGKDALLVVLRDAANDSRVTVYVMDATCVKQASSTTAKVLLKDSYPRS
ncbi:membrane protein [Streptomyces viridochromogenes]|uniref:Membrane protein n=1 Tax=Streptomyces viridochromogenes TaxID=1938 RepID=A0A0J7ZHM6_STRVR|nr:membrane protein [Streptomyces viridochromogenes]KMS74643.1 membrane protein [Streptomyces viridochromogenes]KOG13208.1 membrane protein [Streptomyces viridochromogenes]KOG22958.1 membrane protein [Streptomyces viridochromogenes]